MNTGIGGIILAGGKSSRMGSDKGLMPFRGRMLVEYGIRLLTGLTDEIIISTNQAGYEEFGLKTVSDIFPDCGPLGGLHAALSESEFDWNIVVSCDTPFLEPELFNSLLACRVDFLSVIPKHTGGIEPMAGLYHRALVGPIAERLKSGNLKTQQFLAENSACFFDANPLLEKYPQLFFNLNRPEELQSLL